MNDLEIDQYITWQIKKRKINLYDMIGGEYIDPDPGNVETPVGQRARPNRFKTLSGWERLCELLTKGKFDPDNPYGSLAVPLRDLVRYWWTNMVDQDVILENIFDDIFTVYKDRLLPKEKEEERPDFSDALDEVEVAL
ncbi:MAG: hypothetical protein AB1512_02855 [Thermodesulfobacteriota bacterium]